MAWGERKTGLFLAILCSLSYAGSYLGRLNYSAALPEMVSEHILTKTCGGLIATVYFASYGAGQLINGLLADRGSPKVQVSVGMAGSAACNLLMYGVRFPPAMLVLWGLNGCAQSLIWAPAFLMVSRGIRGEYRAKALLLLNTAPSAGTIASYLFSGAILHFMDWRALFLGASLALAALLAVWLRGCGAVERQLSGHQASIDGQGFGGSAPRPPAEGRRMGISLLISSGAVLLIPPSMITGMLKDGITSWLPTYLAEEFSMSAGMAMIASVLLPLLHMAGAAAGYWLIRLLQNTAACAALLFFCTAGCAALLSLAGALSPAISILLFALITAMMMAVSILFTSEAPSQFAGFGIAASVSGFFNGCGYAGAAISMYGVASIADSSGWGVVRIIWTAAALLAAVCAMAAVPLWKRAFPSDCLREDRGQPACPCGPRERGRGD